MTQENIHTVVLGFQKEPKQDSAWYWKLAANLIKWWTNSKYFHVEIAIGDKWIVCDGETGTVAKEYDPTYFNPHFDYYRLTLNNDLTFQQFQIISSWVDSQLYSEYDWLGIFASQIFKFGRESPEKWFCSEFVCTVLQQMRVVKVTPMIPCKTSPAELFRSLEFQMERIYFKTIS